MSIEENVFIDDHVALGKNVSIGRFSEVHGLGAGVVIGDNCDIASFVSINVADSHKKCIGIIDYIERYNITIENNVFVGSHCFIGGGTYIGNHSVIAAGEIVIDKCIPSYSLVVNGEVKEGYYKNRQRHSLSLSDTD